MTSIINTQKVMWHTCEVFNQNFIDGFWLTMNKDSEFSNQDHFPAFLHCAVDEFFMTDNFSRA